MLALLVATAMIHPQRPIQGFRNETGKWVAPLDVGKPTVLFFVLADCPVARKYSIEMKRLSIEYPMVAFYSVHTDASATLESIAKYRKEFGLPFSSLLDPQQILVRRTSVSVVPTAVLFGSDNRVHYCGRIDDRFPALGVQRDKPRRQDLRVALNEYLAGKPVTVPKTSVVGCTIPSP